MINPATVRGILSNLTDDLRRAPWKGNPNPLAGHCYVASEALYHSLGDRVDWTPCTVRHEGAVHWFLRHRDGRIADLTAGQFLTIPDYSSGRGRGFLTRQPSKRTQVVLDKLQHPI